MRRLKNPHPSWNASTSDGKNFQCLVVIPATGKIYGQRIKCAAGKQNNEFRMTQALGHLKAQIHVGTKRIKPLNAKSAKPFS
jgi:hypothetical protein